MPGDGCLGTSDFEVATCNLGLATLNFRLATSDLRLLTCHVQLGTCDYLTACFNALPAANFGTRRFGILIAAPVCGLRAVRAFRCVVLKVPKPTNDTESPFFSALVTVSISVSIAQAALVFVRPASFAIFATISCLFMAASGKVTHDDLESRAHRNEVRAISRQNADRF